MTVTNADSITSAYEEQDFSAFREAIWAHYKIHRRAFPWRDVISPYRVVVSEIMLQQTQAHRVVAKFEPFISQFYDFASLASAPFSDVLALWKGLGYNRRALALQKIAQHIVHYHDGILPQDPAILSTFSGIGKATAASIVAFAFNLPTVFIETNIRTVFINAFFANRDRVFDREIEPLVALTVDQDSPREWYYALMDYGVMLKKTIGNENKKSAHYTRQSRFLGSNRELRGKILQALLDNKLVERTTLPIILQRNHDRVDAMLSALVAEGLVREHGGMVFLP